MSFLWEGFSHQIGVLQLLYYSKVKVVKIAIISYNRFFGSFLWEGFSRQTEVIQLLYYSSYIQEAKESQDRVHFM